MTLPDVPIHNIPPPLANDTHYLVRNNIDAQTQIDHFLRTRQFANFCGGPCHGDNSGSAIKLRHG